MLVPLSMTLALMAACQSDDAASRHPLARTQFWQRYLEMPHEKALAISGDPEGVWVGGTAGGLESSSEAQADALAECERQRARRRMQPPCTLYAVGTELQIDPARLRRPWP